MSRPRFLMLTLVALTLAAGCGGGSERLSKAAYEQKLKQAGVELATPSGRLANANTAQQFISTAGEVQRAMRKVADDLDEINPPKDVAAANDQLVDALRAIADEFEQVKEAAKGGANKARDAGARLARSKPSEDARQAVTYISRLGYDVGLLSGA
jgi:hypothetical protein